MEEHEVLEVSNKQGFTTIVVRTTDGVSYIKKSPGHCAKSCLFIHLTEGTVNGYVCGRFRLEPLGFINTWDWFPVRLSECVRAYGPASYDFPDRGILRLPQGGEQEWTDRWY